MDCAELTDGEEMVLKNASALECASAELEGGKEGPLKGLRGLLGRRAAVDLSLTSAGTTALPSAGTKQQGFVRSLLVVGRARLPSSRRPWLMNAKRRHSSSSSLL